MRFVLAMLAALLPLLALAQANLSPPPAIRPPVNDSDAANKGYVDAATPVSLTACRQASDPSGDWTLAFGRCYAIGRPIYVPPGDYGVCAVVLPSNSTLRGAGRTRTRIYALAGCNKDVFVGTGFYSLTGTETYTGGANNWLIADLTIDGNKTAQSSSTPDSVNGLASYGYKWALERVVVTNCLGNCLRTEWVTYGEFPGGSPAKITDVVLDTAGRRGWWENGPHDMQVVGLEIIDASQETDNTWDALWTSTKGSGKLTNYHSWHRAAATNRYRYGISSGGGLIVENSHIEGGRGWIEHRGNGDQIIGSQMYALEANVVPATLNQAPIVFRGVQNIHVGNNYKGPYAAQARPLFQLGDSSGGSSFQNQIIGGIANGFSGGVASIINSGGYNSITLGGYANGSTACPAGLLPTDLIVYTDQIGGGCFQTGSTTMGDTVARFPTGLTIRPSAHSSGSKRAGVQLDSWLAAQDSQGNGTKDFTLSGPNGQAFNLSPANVPTFSALAGTGNRAVCASQYGTIYAASGATCP